MRRIDRLYAHLRITGTTTGYDDLVRAAVRGRMTLDQLVAVLRAGGDAATQLVQRLDLPRARRLGTLLADQGRPDDAALLLRAMFDVLGPDSLRKEARFVLAEIAVDAGETHELGRLLERLLIHRDDPAQGWLLTANATNPFRSRGRQEQWLAALNGLFAMEDLAPVSVAEGDGGPFDRLSSSAPAAAEGPLVTVIVPTYAPGARLKTAVESLLAQTHRNLQILIVDDCSPEPERVALAAWRKRDPRIEVVYLSENNGPYLARNIAVAEHARGDYITVHDDDDWSHPQKLARQVEHLEAHPEVLANMCNGVRASDDLWFGRVNGNPVWTQQALSSLMVRRRVFDDIGYWDVVNRAGDAEFNDRIRAWTRSRIPIVGRTPLMFYRVRWGSLSDGEFRRGYMDARRRWYFHAYRAWHEEELAAGRVPRMPPDNRGMRPFAAPHDFLGPRAAAAERQVEADVAVTADFRRRNISTRRAMRTVERELARGSVVAIRQTDSPRPAPNSRIDARILRAARHPRARVVSMEDRLRAQRVVGTTT